MSTPFLRLLPLLLASNWVLADAPLPPPSLLTKCNISKSHCATSDPTSHSITIHTVNGKRLWSIERYARFFELSNDGVSLIVYTDFGNLVPLNATLDSELFTIYRNGAAIHTVRIGELFDDVAALPRTSSHYAWGNLLRIDDSDNAIFLLSTGQQIIYSLRTGTRSTK